MIDVNLIKKFLTLLIILLLPSCEKSAQKSNEDVSPPQCVILYPADGESVFGQVVIQARATDNQKLKEVYREINEMEKAKIKTIEYDVDLPEKADIFILAAIALLFIEFIANKLIFKSVS